MNFIERNELRQRQLAFNKKWVRTVGDRVQLSRDFNGHSAWTSATIIKIEDGVLGILRPCERTTIKLDSGEILDEPQLQTSSGGYVNFIPLVSHEDYFKDVPTAPLDTTLAEENRKLREFVQYIKQHPPTAPYQSANSHPDTNRLHDFYKRAERLLEELAQSGTGEAQS